MHVNHAGTFVPPSMLMIVAPCRVSIIFADFLHSLLSVPNTLRPSSSVVFLRPDLITDTRLLPLT